VRASGPRLLRLLLLVIWALFFLWLLASGEMYRYIGPRTRWVVPLGALILALSAVAQARTLRNASTHERLDRKELVGLLSFLVPIALVALIPKPTLGSEAAARKSTGSLVSAAGAFTPLPQQTGKVSFQEINYASESDEYAALVGVAEGMRVKLTGFVTHPPGATQATFALTRFATFCCAADAVPHSVAVDAGDGGDRPDDTWLSISGVLEKRGRTFVLDAQHVKEVDEPENPYI
jgi:uncharacterized repeat protein (TIGR03943 family)